MWKVCKVPCHNCHIYETWSSRDLKGGSFKVIILRGMWEEGKSQREKHSFYGGADPSIRHEEESHYVIPIF